MESLVANFGAPLLILVMLFGIFSEDEIEVVLARFWCRLRERRRQARRRREARRYP